MVGGLIVAFNMVCSVLWGCGAGGVTLGDRNLGQFPSLRSEDLTWWRFRVLLSVTRSAEVGAESREREPWKLAFRDCSDFEGSIKAC